MKGQWKPRQKKIEEEMVGRVTEGISVLKSFQTKMKRKLGHKIFVKRIKYHREWAWGVIHISRINLSVFLGRYGAGQVKRKKERPDGHNVDSMGDMS